MRSVAIVALLYATAHAQQNPSPGSVDAQAQLDESDELVLFQLRAERIVSTSKTKNSTAAVPQDNISMDQGLRATPVTTDRRFLGTNLSDSSGRITAYIQFGKVGSSSIRNMLEYRAAKHGWPVVDEDATCKKHRVTGEECEKKKAYECELATAAGLPCGKHLCLAENNAPGSTARPDCAGSPSDSVVLVTNPGYCEALAAHSSRPCSYMTVLREPVDRIISEYNYWCLDCLDKVEDYAHEGKHEGIFCGKDYHCPDRMSITAWARRHGNEYTRRLATRKGHETLAGGFYSDVGYLSSKLTEDDFEAALSVLQADNMLALSIEELEVGVGGKPSGMEQLADFLEDPIVLDPNTRAVETNQHEHTYQPTKKELHQLQNILDYDIRLYKAWRA